MDTVAELELAAFAGQPVSAKGYANAQATAAAAARLAEIARAGEAEREAERRKSEAQAELEAIERDLSSFIIADKREGLVEEIANLVDRYTEESKTGIATLNSLRNRFFDLKKRFPEYEPDAEVGYGQFRIGKTFVGSIIQGVGPKERHLREAITEITRKLAAKLTK